MDEDQHEFTQTGSNLTEIPMDYIPNPRHIDTLDLSNNPDIKLSRLGEFKRLARLSLNSCNLREIPEGIADLTQLQQLSLSKNPCIRECKGTGGLPRTLRKLSLASCGISSFKFDKMEQLECLLMSDNGCLRSLDNESLEQFEVLEKLDISSCNIKSLPATLGHLTKLTHLELNHNRRLQDVSAPWSSLKFLKVLNISECAIQALPESLFDLHQLEELLLAGNKCLQQISPLISKLKKLKVLDVRECALNSFPATDRALPQLERLLVSGNQFQSLDCPFVRNLSNLKELDASRCGLTSLPRSRGRLEKLETLKISENNDLRKLQWSFIGQLPNLTKLDASKCGLKSLPGTKTKNSPIEHLLISGNKYLQLLDWQFIASLSRLKELDASSCDLGEICNWSNEVTQLEEINLANNPLKAEEIDFGKVNCLQKLVLSSSGWNTSNTRFTACSQLVELSISDSEDLKYLNESMQLLKYLKILEVKNCGITSFPKWVSKVPKLQKLSFSGNTFCENIESPTNGFLNLRMLNLSSCELRHFPNWICSIRQLEVLLLSHNKLQTVSGDFGNLEKLKELDLDSCDLRSLPTSFEKLKQLEILILRNNVLLANPEQYISNMKSLRNVDLSKVPSRTEHPANFRRRTTYRGTQQRKKVAAAKTGPEADTEPPDNDKVYNNIRHSYSEIRGKLSLEETQDITASLFSEDCILPQEKENILSELTPTGAASKLLDLILKKNNSKLYSKFLHALKHIVNRDDIAELITRQIAECTDTQL